MAGEALKKTLKHLLNCGLHNSPKRYFIFIQKKKNN